MAQFLYKFRDFLYINTQKQNYSEDNEINENRLIVHDIDGFRLTAAVVPR
jgi:hypothetical protein